MRLFWAGIAGLALGALVLAAAPHAQLLNAGHLSVSVSQAERVFDNGGNPWPFFTVEPAVNYDQCGANCAYVATPNASCATNGSSYRPDYINFNTDAGQTPAFRIGCFLASYSFKYIINISQSGPYIVNLVMANGGGSSATVSISLDNNPVAATASIPTTGSYNTFTTVASGQFNATIGNHILKVACTTGDSTNNACGDFRSLQGSAVGSGPLTGSILPPGNWTLSKNDEFNASFVDTTLFTLVNGCEFGCGVYSVTSAASESGGFLNLDGADQSGCPGTDCGVVLKTLLPGAGYYEARLRSGVGFYNVFWTNQTSNTDCGGGYDVGFESDIMETQGGGGAGQVNTHWNGYMSCHQSSGPGYIYSDAANGYHVYGVWIDATNGITYYRDGVQTDHLNGPLTTAASTDRTVYFHTELSPGSQKFSIDWFRYYQKS